MSEATVIALGFFDGVHLGHGALLRKTAERARELGVTPAAFTFDRSPKEFVTGVPVPLLTSAAERAEIIREYYGIGTVFVEPFDRAMMTMPWEDFITELLVKKYRAVHLVAGHDFRFGYKNQGDPEKLREKCRALGLGCDIIPKVELDGVTVSSTYIRSLIEAGEVERAARFLGHPHRMSGTVCHGEGIGRKRLFPTANLVPDAHSIVPKRGVYATRAYLPDGTQRVGVTNVGVKPTVGSDHALSETWMPDFTDGDLYGRTLRLELLSFVRDEKKFPNLDALKAEISLNEKTARTLFEAFEKK